MPMNAPVHTANPITVRMTPSMGRGVFAGRAIARGELLGEFFTIRLPAGEVKKMAGTSLSTFWFEDGPGGDAFVVLGWIELVNHSLTPNTDRSWRPTPEGEIVSVHAVRDIALGEQLFIDYRFDPRASNPPWA